MIAADLNQSVTNKQCGGRPISNTSFYIDTQ